jgi:hypothetical protein
VVSYKILHHVAGRTRISVPVLKNLPLCTLTKLASIPVADGILAVEPNFLSRNIMIKCDPMKIDILDYLRTMASHPEFEKAIKGESS